MTDLSENAPFDGVTEVSNTDTQEQSDIETVSESDAEIDAINEILAETEDLENNTHDFEKDARSDSENDDISENNTHEVSEENETRDVAENTTTDEPVGITDRLESSPEDFAENTTVEESDEQFGNTEQLEPDFEIPEPEPYVCPWADAPKNTIFYEKIYEDGHLGSFTESAEMAYKMGWYENRISKDDVQQSDINGWTYRKEVCPMKSEQAKQIELWNREIFELKEELSRTDYKAIKYAEGVLTDEEYQETGIQRQVWRKRINELEKLIAG